MPKTFFTVVLRLRNQVASAEIEANSEEEAESIFLKILKNKIVVKK